MQASVKIMDIDVDMMSNDVFVRKMNEYLTDDHLDVIMFASTKMLNKAMEDEEYRALLEKADLFLPGEKALLATHHVDALEAGDMVVNYRSLGMMLENLIKEDRTLYIIADTEEAVEKLLHYCKKMQPELQAIQKKYKNKTDAASRQKMGEETQEVYNKYGVSPSGTCLQLFITFPILLALYRVIINVPAYVNGVKGVFSNLVNAIYTTDGFDKILTDYVDAGKINNLTSKMVDFSAKDTMAVKNNIVDVLYKMPSDGWNFLQDKFGSLTDLIQTTHDQVEPMVTFLGLNIADSPLSTIKSSFASHSWLMLIGALLIPIISYVTQVINIKMMPQPQQTQTGDSSTDAMAAQMKTMNIIMPLFSFVMCFTVPVGLGIYWISAAVFRGVQQFFINKHMEKIDLNDIIAKNQEKMKKKREKLGISEEDMKKAAKIKTKNISYEASSKEKEEKLKEADEKKRHVKADSMAAKANLVREFNEGKRQEK